jgi:hypothetical protein
MREGGGQQLHGGREAGGGGWGASSCTVFCWGCWMHFTMQGVQVVCGASLSCNATTACYKPLTLSRYSCAGGSHKQNIWMSDWSWTCA